METQLPNSKELFQLVCLDKSVPLIGGVLRVGRYLIGRSESCDIILGSTVVSAIHAVLEVTPNGLKIYDMNSKNGTYVDNKKIVAKDISVNETIALGNIPIQVLNYSVDSNLPPVLDALDPLKGDASLLKTLPKSTPDLEKTAPATPAPTEDIEDDGIPYIVYPLSADPNSDYSEYIFEDADQLYPIFKYDIKKHSVEVIILFKDKVYSVDYLPDKKAVYEIAGLRKKKSEVEFPYLGKEEKLPFVEISSGNCVVHQLHRYEMVYLTDNDVKKATDGRVNVQENDIVKLTNGDLEIYVRRVPSPPKVKAAPFFSRDKEMRKNLLWVFLLVFIPLLSLHFYEVDPEKLEEKDPERIATILYKQELKVNTNKTIEKTLKKKEKKKKQKSDKKKVSKTQKNNTATAPNKANAATKKTQNPGSKQAKVTQTVKRSKKAGKKTTNKPTPKRARAKPNNKASAFKQSKNKAGKIDVYKSSMFKTNFAKSLAKGGSTLSNARVAKTNSAKIGSAGVSGGTSSLAKARVDATPGELYGRLNSTKLGSSKGSEGLAAKTGVYTAGIPSQTVVLGSMDPDVIRRILREHIPQFRSCYQKELNSNTGRNISGTIRLVFTIGSSGGVSKAGIDGSSPLPGRVRGCVVNVLRGIRFPSPLGGGTVDVKQPFNFYPKRI